MSNFPRLSIGLCVSLMLVSNCQAQVAIPSALKAQLDVFNALATQLRRAQEAATQRPPAARPETRMEVRDEAIPPVALSKTLQRQTDEQRASVAGSLESDIKELEEQLNKRLDDPNKTSNLLNEIDALNATLTAKRQARDFALGEVTKVSNAAAESFAATNNPYFLVCRDVLWTPKDPLKWSDRIAPQQAALLKAGRSVGMISRDGQLVGTAFVVGPSQVLTNLHVLKDIAKLDPTSKRWKINSNVKLQFDVEYPLGDVVGCSQAHATRTYYLNGVWALSQQQDDMVVLLTSRDADYPARLNVAARPPEKYRGNMEVAVLGYPGPPADMTVTEQVEYFQTPQMKSPQFPYKRLSAGFTGTEQVTADGVFTHKANTAGGNSGSPVFDLDDGSVVGMHMQGHNRFNSVMGYNEGITSQRILLLLKTAGLNQ